MPTRSRPPEERFWERINKTESCWLWTGYTGSRYGRLFDHGKTIPAHRLSYEIHKGPIPDGMYVCHSCDVTICVNPEHLFLGTQSENMRDMVKKGRHAYQKGGINNMAKLTPELVAAIRSEEPCPSHKLADKYGVSSSTIRRVKRGDTWRTLYAQ